MLELLDLFRKEYEEAGDAYILDKIKLPMGLYIRVNDDLTIDEGAILLVNNSKREEYPMDLYDWYLEKEFYSRIYSQLGVYDTNRVIRDKKIHCINPYSLFIKRSTLPDVCQDFEGSLNKHFEAMETLYADLGLNVDYNQYRYNFVTLSKNIIELSDKYKLDGKSPIKIFFNKNKEEYILFFEEYFRKKIFTNREKNMNVEINGVKKSPLAFENVGNADKKPFLQMRTVDIKTPYMSSYEESLMFYKMSFIMKFLKDKFKDQIFLEIGGESVEEYEVINTNKKPKPYKNFEILTIENPADIIENPHETMVERNFIEKKLNFMFKGLLYALYYSEPKKIYDKKNEFSDRGILSEMIMNRETFKNYFVKKHDVNLFNIVEKITLLILEYEIKNNGLSKLDMIKHRQLWDLRMSLLNYFSERSRYDYMPRMMKEIIIKTKEQIENSEEFFEIANDEMFYFLAGQVAGFLVNLTESKNKTGRLYSPFLDASNVEKVKELIMQNYQNYGHKISAYSEAPINKVIQAINYYEAETPLKNKEMKNIFYAGLIGKNVFYMKRNNAETNNENNEGEYENDTNE